MRMCGMRMCDMRVSFVCQDIAGLPHFTDAVPSKLVDALAAQWRMGNIDLVDHFEREVFDRYWIRLQGYGGQSTAGDQQRLWTADSLLRATGGCWYRICRMLRKHDFSTGPPGRNALIEVEDRLRNELVGALPKGAQDDTSSTLPRRVFEPTPKSTSAASAACVPDLQLPLEFNSDGSVKATAALLAQTVQLAKGMTVHEKVRPGTSPAEKLALRKGTVGSIDDQRVYVLWDGEASEAPCLPDDIEQFVAPSKAEEKKAKQKEQDAAKARLAALPDGFAWKTIGASHADSMVCHAVLTALNHVFLLSGTEATHIRPVILSESKQMALFAQQDLQATRTA